MTIKKVLSGALASAALLASSATVALAQTTESSTTPGVPNTGVDATTNLLVLGVTALVLVIGGVYLARKFAEQ